MVGPFTGRRKFTAFVFGSMLLMSVLSAGAGILSEGHSATTLDPAVMEGKEVRFGADASALWAMLTTQTSNGSVNSMHDSLAPLTGLGTLVEHADQRDLGRHRLRPAAVPGLPAAGGVPRGTDDRAHAGVVRSQDRSA